MNRFEREAVQAGLRLDDDLRQVQDDIRRDLDRAKEWMHAPRDERGEDR